MTASDSHALQADEYEIVYKPAIGKALGVIVDHVSGGEPFSHSYVCPHFLFEHFQRGERKPYHHLLVDAQFL